MKQSLDGLLLNVAHAIGGPTGRDRHGYAFTLRELLKNLREVRRDPGRLNEFFELYVDEGFETWDRQDKARQEFQDQLEADFNTETTNPEISP